MPTDVQSVTSVTPACGKGHTASTRATLNAARERLQAAINLVRFGIASGSESVPQDFASPLYVLLLDCEERITSANLSADDEDRLRNNDKPLGGLLTGVMHLAQRADRDQDDLGGLSLAELHLSQYVLGLACDQLDAYLAEVRA